MDQEGPDNDVDPTDINKLISKSGGKKKRRSVDGLVAAEDDGGVRRSTTPVDMPSVFREMQRRDTNADEDN